MSKRHYERKFGRKAGVTKRNRAVRDRIANDLNLFRSLAECALAIQGGASAINGSTRPFPVWSETGQYFLQTHPGQKLGKWRDQTEFFKLLLCSQVVLEYKGYAFTVKVNPALEGIWRENKAKIYDCIKSRVTAALRSSGLDGIGMAYVLEGKSMNGSRTGLHLHGMVCGIDQGDLRAFKLAMESALEVGFRRRGKGSGLDFHSFVYYDEIDQGNAGASAKWPSYCMKSVMVKDDRLPNQRMFMNQRMRQMTKRLWGVITDAPLGRE